ncbi:MAG: aldo/keto reductase [Clostridiaceae bacterium]|nr:aldo/keto reductase [Clostridiaceae bacterium]
MLTRTNVKNGQELSILGFGCMRLPNKAGIFDESRCIHMIRTAIENGVNYFDTAYIYHAGKNEILLGKALEGPWRERVNIATKLPVYMVGRLQTAKKMFESELTRLMTDSIDYYLLHMLTDYPMFLRMKEIGVIEWLEKKKREGVIRNLGFSFHGSKNAFREILTAYPWDFCQIQYNYLDENNQAGKEGLMLAASLGIPVIVMEPIRGGMLANQVPETIRRIFDRSGKQRSMAEWALRWVWDHKEVTVVLSGMSDEAQLSENIRIAQDAKPESLTAEERMLYERVKKELASRTKVPCTGCGYCMPCPFGVDIPGCFSRYNEKFLIPQKHTRMKYLQALGIFSEKPGYASVCTQCGRCESHCPQHIAIRQELKKVRKTFEGPLFGAMVRIGRSFLRIRKPSG